jgi:hypothetical protein
LHRATATRPAPEPRGTECLPEQYGSRAIRNRYSEAGTGLDTGLPVRMSIPLVGTRARRPGLERAGGSSRGSRPGTRRRAAPVATQRRLNGFSLEVPMNAGAHVIEPRPRQRALPALLEDVRQARIVLRQARRKVAQSRGGSATMHTRAAQQHLAKALRNYEEALTARRLPVPHALRDEMRLYRRVLGPNSPDC